MRTKHCQQCESTFTIYPEDRKFYDKISVPAPTLCPSCRFQKRVALRNHSALCQRKCDLCKKDMVSIYTADKPHTIYCPKCWWSDEWDPIRYAKDFDFKRPFFDQFAELLLEVPRQGLFNKNTENAEYNNDISDSRDCYLSTVVYLGSEGVYYSFLVLGSKDIIDSSLVYDSELVCNSVSCRDSYGILYSMDIKDSRDCAFSYDLRSCQSCLFCSGLRHKQFYVRNNKVSSEQYKSELAKAVENKVALEKSKVEFEKLRLSYPHRPYTVINGENCIGNNIINCKDCFEGYDLKDSQNCRYSYSVVTQKDCVDCYGGSGGEMCYEVSNYININKCYFCKTVWDSHDIMYSWECFNSHDLFGCIGLRNKAYCIFNKQYAKDEYIKLRDKIIEHMKETGEYGQNFPMNISPFAYNESAAQLYMPRSKEDVNKLGLVWREEGAGVRGRETKNVADLPDRISEIGDGILDEVLACNTCGKNYKVVKSALKLYKKFGVMIPVECPDCRRVARARAMPVYPLHKRKCAECVAETDSIFGSDLPYRVLCMKCYEKKIN